MGEPLSPDRLFDFPMDEPHPAYDFFAHAPLLGYVVGEIAEQMVMPAVEEVAEPVVKAEEEQMIAPVIDVVEGPSTVVAEGRLSPQSDSGLPVPSFVFKDLSTRLGYELGGGVAV
ncbi:hypothetical protein Tco_0560795 [Tanacetum coccineum]